MWHLESNSQMTLGNNVNLLFSHIKDMLEYMESNHPSSWHVEFIQVYSKPEKVEGKEKQAPLVPLSRAKD